MDGGGHGGHDLKGPDTGGDAPWRFSVVPLMDRLER